MSACQVCSTDASRYKCPACQLPYCSAKCYKTHRSEHHGGDESSSDPNEKQIQENRVSEAVTKTQDDTAEKDSATGSPDAFVALRKSEQLQQLFETYPQLKAQLHSIYTSTLEPTASPVEEDARQRNTYQSDRGRGRGRGRGREGTGRPWTAERGFKNGLYRLKRAKDTQALGVAEFEDLVIAICPLPDAMTTDQLLGGDEGRMPNLRRG